MIDEQLPFMGMETPSNYFKCIFYDGHSLEEEKPSNVDVKMEKPDYDADTEDENMAQPVEPEIQEISTENITQTMANAATSSFSDTNPWILFEAGVTCVLLSDGSAATNSRGEKIVQLREFHALSRNQRQALVRQEVNRKVWAHGSMGSFLEKVSRRADDPERYGFLC